MKKLCVICILFSVCVNITTAEPLGMEFIHIGNAGNADDNSGYGGVSYGYYISKYEVTNAQWNAFVNSAGAPTGNPSIAYDESAYWTGTQLPNNEVSWYEAAQFCNWLTSGNKSFGAYQLDVYGNITVNRTAAVTAYGKVYVIPTQDEWYKAAYYKPDGSGYSLYANGLNEIPAADNGWNYYGGAYDSPWNVGTGIMEQNGTYDMMGNVWEWTETLLTDGTFVLRGGSYRYDLGSGPLSAAQGYNRLPDLENINVGFRVAEVPEPCTVLLLGLGGVALPKRRRRKETNPDTFKFE